MQNAKPNNCGIVVTEESKNPIEKLVGKSPEIAHIKKLVMDVARFDANILLIGESGTGKEVVAQSIHATSPRKSKPFVAVNCCAIPPDLLESELFGHEKGSFTGANSSRRGRFELAEGGTLFLDEIGDMPMSMQVKLLRVIQERCFERVGGAETYKTNVRIITATHQDLEQRITEGKFREDLFYRLNVFPIQLPPLRKRACDIPMLLEKMADEISIAMGQQQPIRFTESAVNTLCKHALPGNVRELRNLVERLTILFPGEMISTRELPEQYHSIELLSDAVGETQKALSDLSFNEALKPRKIDLKAHLKSMEKNLIYQALDEANWVVSQAAEALNLRRTTLIQKIRRLNITNQSKQVSKAVAPLPTEIHHPASHHY